MIVVAGEALQDLVPSGAPRGWTAYPGGSPCNTAVAAARLGARTAFLGRLSRDVFGQDIRAHLAAAGVDLTTVVDADEPSTLAVVSTDAEGVATYGFYYLGTSDFAWREGDRAELPAGCRAVHVGSLASAVEPTAGLLASAVASAGPQVVRSYDPNVRPSLGLDKAEYRALVERWVESTDLVRASQDDLAWLYPDTPPLQVAARWQSSGPRLVVVSCGADGAAAVLAGGEVHVPAQYVTVVDTVGAGDAFTAGLLVALDEAGALTRDGLAALSAPALEPCLTFAATAAAATCGRAGADPPSRPDLDSALEAARG
ncbi:MAG: carbohydrate kinase family protein [Streptosporangiales bacterium]